MPVALATQLQLQTIDRVWDKLREIGGEVSPRTMDDIAAVRDLIPTIPRMSYDRNEALQLHEEAVNQYAVIGKLSVSAQLVDEGARPSWLLQ